MALTKERLAKEVVKAALSFERQWLWDRISDEEIFAVRLPGRDRPIHVSIMGGSGITTGVMLFTGEDSAGDARDLLSADPASEDVIDGITHVGLSFEKYRDIPAEHRRILALARFASRAEARAPFLYAKEKGRAGRVLSREELETMLFVLNAALLADAEGELWPGPFVPGEDVLTVLVAGDPRRPEVSTRFETVAPLPRLADHSPPAVPDSYSRLPRREVRWHVAFALAPARVRDDDRIPRVLLVAQETGDEEEMRPILAEFLPGTEIAEAARRLLAAPETGGRDRVPGLPASVRFSNRALFGLVGPALAAADVPSCYEPLRGPLFELVEDLFAELGMGRPGEEVLPSGDPGPGRGLPELRNTEGHEFVWHVGTFAVRDPAAVRAALAARDDVDAFGEEWVWLDRAGNENLHGPVSRGRIQLLPGELLFEANSRERFELAKAWIGAIPGVSFVSVRRSGPGEMLAGGVPLDDRLNPPPPIEPSPELEAALNGMLSEHYMRWLDQRLPMFGGRTPREMCATEAGRRKVRRAIEEIEPPMSAPGLAARVPKEEMLRSLRLDG